MQAIKAIETKFKGYRFRSRLEARYAVFFDALGVKWEYEREGYELSSGRYLPDFFLPEQRLFVEIKPDGGDDRKGIYLAGKMTEWRRKLILNGNVSTGPDTDLKHLPGLHGSYYDGGDSVDPNHVIASCRRGMQEADAFFIWIDSVDSFASLIESGAAWQRGMPIFGAVSKVLFPILKEKAGIVDYTDHCSGHGEPQFEKPHDLWFLEKISTRFGWFDSPQSAIDTFFPLDAEETKCAELSAGGNAVMLCRGDPVDASTMRFMGGHGYYRNSTNKFFKWDIRGLSDDDIDRAAAAARSARFEFGENG